jgi:hypothetical protein
MAGSDVGGSEFGGVGAVAGAGDVGSASAVDLLKALFEPGCGLRKILPVAIEGAPKGLCVRTLTDAEVLRLQALQEHLDAYMDLLEGPIDAAALTAAGEAPDQSPEQIKLLRRGNARVSLRVGLTASMVACDARGNEVCAPKTIAKATGGDAEGLPCLEPLPVLSKDSASDSPYKQCSASWFLAQEAWQRGMIVQACMSFDVAVALARGGKELSQETRVKLGKVSWSSQSSSD